MRHAEQFAEFVAARQTQLLRLTLALTGNHTAAEDLAQASLVRLWPRWEKVSADGDPWRYLQRIVLNTRTTWWRKNAKMMIDGQDAPDLPARGDEYEAADSRHVISEWVARLPPRQRLVIVARYLLDMSVEESAQALDCSTGTVKSQTAKALQQLRGIAQLGLEANIGEGSDS